MSRQLGALLFEHVAETEEMGALGPLTPPAGCSWRAAP